MSLVQQLIHALSSRKTNSKTNSNIASAPLSPQIQPASPPPPPKPKSLTELEREINAVVRPISSQPTRQNPFAHLSRVWNKLIWTMALLGVPVGLLWLINLPYSPIRQSVARHAPLLLVPSYLSMDHHYRQAIAAIEQAAQLIDHPTSPSDLEVGAQELAEAQQHLDQLPIRLDDWSDYQYDWYSWRLTPVSLLNARTQAGRLKAKVFQETNAQTTLLQAEQSLTTAKQQYQQAKSLTDKQGAIALWQAALNQLEQVPMETLAGRTARQSLAASQRDFQAIVGLTAGDQRTVTLITAARQFSWQAAQAAQHPPHAVEEWQQIEALWQQAIHQLEGIPTSGSFGMNIAIIC
jgi:hypothetical protein